MLLISFIDGSALDSRQDEVVAQSDRGSKKFFVREGDTLRAIPEQLVMSKIYPQGIIDPPLPEDYIYAHPEVQEVDWSLMDQLREPN